MNFSYRNPAVALPVLLWVLLLTGCGASTKTVTVAGAPLNGEGSVAPTHTSPPPTGPVVHLSAFRSPTGNIGCSLLAGQARCDIQRRSWSPPARPKSCPTIVDFGQGLQMQTTGPSRFVCAGDTARDPTSPALAYGTTSIYGPFECISASSGMTCTRPSDGHGFFLSIQTFRLF